MPGAGVSVSGDGSADGQAGQVRVSDVVGSDELPEDPRGYAKANCGRKVFKMLDRMAIPPFVAGLLLHQRHEWAIPDRVGVYTISGWDPATPAPAGPAAALTPADFYLHPPGVTDYLRRMPNNAICQMAITTKMRGPNVHFVGGADSLALLTSLAAAAISDGAADAAVITAFDPPDADRAALPDDADAIAAAFLLQPAGAVDGVDGGLAGVEELLAGLQAAPAGTGAVAALQSWIAGLREKAS
jgi:hypothetical protein